MSKLRVLITSPPLLAVIERYKDEFTSRDIEIVLKHPKQFFAEKEIRELIKDFDGIICGDDEITEEVISGATRLKIISKWGVGIDSIDRKAAEKHGIAVCNSPSAFGEACADVAMGYLIMLARSLHKTHLDSMSGRWIKKRGILLKGRTLGIVGVGNIGREVAKRANAFGLHVIGNDIIDISQKALRETGVTLCDKDYLFRNSDFIAICCDLNITSRHLINAEALGKMKNSSYIINVARGPIVDTIALVDALRNGRIAGAALDVFESEPLPPDSPLRLMDNCILGAHNAYNADIAVEFVHLNTIHNLLKHLCDDEHESKSLENLLDEALAESELAESGVNYVL